MVFFEKFVAKLMGVTMSAKVPAAAQSSSDTHTAPSAVSPIDFNLSVSDAEVIERVRAYDFVLTTDPPALNVADEWWNEDAHARRLREGSQEAYAWLIPFLPLEIAKLEQLQAAQEWGPHGAVGLAKALRAIIKERRKAKVQYLELLSALYAACVVADLSESLKFEGIQPHYMARFVDSNEIHFVKLEYATMGYQFVESLSKTDIKWLIEAFGEPAEHQSFQALFPFIYQNAVARYCWSALRSSNEAAKSLGWSQQSIQGWLNELVKRNIGYQKDSLERRDARQAYLATVGAELDVAWAATRKTFVVADLETTGLDAEKDEILEFAAVQVNSNGSITREFSVLVRPLVSVPAVITRLTGITQAAVDREGLPLSEAIKAFVEFVGSHPVFFHNAPFDVSFIKKASILTKVEFVNPVYDTLRLARQAWPSLDTHKLAALAEFVGASVPEHRGLSDVTATVAVLLAARAKVDSEIN